MVAIDLLADSTNVGYRTTYNALNLCEMPEDGPLKLSHSDSILIAESGASKYWGSLCGYSQYLDADGKCTDLSSGFF